MWRAMPRPPGSRWSNLGNGTCWFCGYTITAGVSIRGTLPFPNLWVYWVCRNAPPCWAAECISPALRGKGLASPPGFRSGRRRNPASCPAPDPAPSGLAKWGAGAAVRLSARPEALAAHPFWPPSAVPAGSVHDRSVGPAPASWAVSEHPDAAKGAARASPVSACPAWPPGPHAVEPPAVQRVGPLMSARQSKASNHRLLAPARMRERPARASRPSAGLR